MSPHDVERWTDADAELPEELHRLLCSGRASLGNAEEVATLQRRLALALGPAAGFGSGGGPPPGFAPEPPVTGSGSAGTGRGEPVRRGRASGQKLGHWGWAAVGGVSLGLAVWAIGMRQAVMPTTSAPPVASAPSRTGSPLGSGESAPSAPAAVEPTSGAPQPNEPSLERGLDSAAGARVAEPARRAKVAKASAPVRAGEAVLLERAREALGGDPERALELTREHQQRFARGVLTQEREVIAIEALKRLGRERAANERAAQFERRYRGSVHQQRLEGTSGVPR
jgi:hypothetical protein